MLSLGCGLVWGWAATPHAAAAGRLGPRAGAPIVMVDISKVRVGDQLRVAGTETRPRFFHVPGHKNKPFVAKGLVGTVEMKYEPGQRARLDRSDERDILLSFDEPAKWKAHFHPSELELTTDDGVEERSRFPKDIEVYGCDFTASGVPAPVQDYMTPIAEATVLSPEMPMLEAATLLQSKNVTGAPVVSNGRLVGVLTQFDFLYQEMRITQGAAGMVKLDSGKWEDAVKKSLAGTVSGAMSKPVAMARDAHMVQVAELMLKRRFNHVPVVDESGAVMGIVTSQDVLRHVLSRIISRSEEK
ncbi:hypothetical protein AB1Y20_010711 [Prymnesium parvum]|uniref:CBS domain-containing protein n=1 Tax=Prymnesium parvum TaxID=97485 RepID=A0AB34IRJ3_PRYPA|mmetsp:Transcript_49953/g.124206  ORF Transcript_49953/g.124206 Transcript_49953/m.124206 type:complete len:300 (-) Transcript_49953:472-1371(-)